MADEKLLELVRAMTYQQRCTFALDCAERAIVLYGNEAESAIAVEALEWSERHVDGKATPEELKAAHIAIQGCIEGEKARYGSSSNAAQALRRISAICSVAQAILVISEDERYSEYNTNVAADDAADAFADCAREREWQLARAKELVSTQ